MYSAVDDEGTNYKKRGINQIKLKKRNKIGGRVEENVKKDIGQG